MRVVLMRLDLHSLDSLRSLSIMCLYGRKRVRVTGRVTDLVMFVPWKLCLVMFVPFCW